MVFSSAVFLFVFLPAVFLLDRLVRGVRLKNALLLAASLIFYAFGQAVYLPLLLVSVLINYLCGLLAAGRHARLGVGLAVAGGIGMMAVYKYADFAISTVNGLFGLSLPLTGIALPIGISFFTFQGLSYVIDVYRDRTLVARSFFKVLLYISFFPQLIAGPIVKYHDIDKEIDDRRTTPQQTALGIRRFICGLSKKLLLSNAVGQMADTVFALPGGEIGMFAAWMGAICYTLQIYFDFSGYSDMAIGMGHMFGFHFLENFNYPYTSTTIKEFWRRWHISLSTWFRDYLYIPLGGNRKGRGRTWLKPFPCVFRHRPVARRKLDLCALGTVARPVFRAGGLRRAAGQAAAGQDARPGVHDAGRGAGLYAVPRGDAFAGGRDVCGHVHRLRPGLDGHGGCVRAPDPGFSADAGFGACAVRTGRAATAPEARRSDPCGRACATRAVHVQPVRRHV